MMRAPEYPSPESVVGGLPRFIHRYADVNGARLYYVIGGTGPKDFGARIKFNVLHLCGRWRLKWASGVSLIKARYQLNSNRRLRRGHPTESFLERSPLILQCRENCFKQ
jgi:hypothetical protein